MQSESADAVAFNDRMQTMEEVGQEDRPIPSIENARAEPHFFTPHAR
jgi:hypothetical protein